jgi:hypothetical protein
MSDTYEQTIKKIGTRSESMRGVVLDEMFDHIGIWVDAKHLADKIGITPKLGNRGGVPCTVKHVTARMTAGHVARRLAGNHCDYRLIVKGEFLALVLPDEENEWRARPTPQRTPTIVPPPTAAL